MNYDDLTSFAFESYTNWLKNNTDLFIGANYLTNDQLFWVVMAVTSFKKYPKTAHQASSFRLIMENFHIYFKNIKGFQEAFKCNMTAEEIERYEKYLTMEAALSNI